ncbi:MAG TPA: hypothetical protein VFQ07_14195, partial [Candidatus Polarisedimenticolia bacterium]|nr:hypothetical protein [Candidatus Polarisedimenticolia bacterium]
MTGFGSARGPRRAVVAAVVAALAVGGALVARPRLEEALRARLEKEAARRGAEASIGAVRLGLWPPLRLHEVAVAKSGLRLEAKQVDLFWRGRTRLNAYDAVLHGPADLSLASGMTAWDLRGSGGSWTLALVKPRPGLVVELTDSPGESDLAVRLSDLAVDRVFDVRRGDRALLEGGAIRGGLRVTDAAGVLAFDVDLTSSSARLPALAAEGDSDPGLGAPMQVELRASGTWRRPEKTLDVPAFSAAVAGATLSGSLAVHDLGADPSVDLSLDVERADFAKILEATGVGAPAALDGAAPPASG